LGLAIRLGIVVALGVSIRKNRKLLQLEIVGKPAPENSFWAILFPQQSSEYGQ
jgi:hypothetical protein